MPIAVNPAKLSAALRGLFPRGAVAAELRDPGDPTLLLPAEAKHLGRAVPKRAREFAAGRLCARRALAEFGLADFAIEMAGDRQPIWPVSIAGSITHTTGYCAAVAAERAMIPALGLDSEVVGAVDPEIWSRICLPGELAWVRGLPAAEQPAAVALVFSAKEAFYKCQYPIAQERLDFHDVRVEAGWGAPDGSLRVHAARTGSSSSTLLPMRGRYLFHQEFVTAGFGLAAEDYVQ